MRSLSVIVMSGHGQAVLRAASYAAEHAGIAVLGTFEKPLHPGDLLLAVGSQARRAGDKSGMVPHESVLPALISALVERRLEVMYQPKVTTEGLRFDGAEALLSDQLPGFGHIAPPALVAAAATRPGLLVRLTHDVMRQAAMACKAWQRSGWPGPVSVNIPVETLLEAGAVEAFLAILDDGGAAPADMILELVEDHLYDSSAAVLATLAKLRLAGYGLALDDVGRRQSGLLQLANLPVTELKIDLEIIRQAREWDKARGIFAALASLGRAIGTKVVAEGVELPADLQLARRHEVDLVQGFIASRKLPLNSLIDNLNRGMLAGSVAGDD